MKFPNWFRILWWVVLLIALTAFLTQRYSDLIAGRAVAADIVVFLIWVGLALAPVFQEVQLFGLKLKQEVQAIRDKLDSLEIKMNASITSQVHQEINLQAPSPGTDGLTPAHEEVIRNLQAEKEVSEKEKGDLKAQVAANQVLGYGWKFAYLNLFFVPYTKYILLWLHSNPNQSRDAFHTNWGTTIPALTERDTILSVLITNGLVIETDSQLSVTQEGLAFLRWIGSVPPGQ